MDSNLKKKLINNIIKDKGGSPEDYQRLIDTIAYHESAHTMDHTIHQQSGGPGRGLFQFEGDKGSNRIYHAAIRTSNYLKSIGESVPNDIKNIIEQGTGDASTLSKETQESLFLGDLRMKGGIDLKDYIDGNLQIQDIWADHWWAGWQQDNDLNKRKDALKRFNTSYKSYLNNYEGAISPSKNKRPTINDYLDKLIDPKNVQKTLNKRPTVNENNQTFNQPQLKESQNNTQIPFQRKKMDFESMNLGKDMEGINSPLDIQKTDLTAMINDKFKNNQTQMSKGGYTNLGKHDKNLNSFDTGGLHEQNPLGGIPLGKDNNGKINTVEQKETSVNLKNGKFIFSHRLKIK